MGLEPKSSMYLRLTPVCFLRAWPKMSSTTSRETESTRRTPAPSTALATTVVNREIMGEDSARAAIQQCCIDNNNQCWLLPRGPQLVTQCYCAECARLIRPATSCPATQRCDAHGQTILCCLGCAPRDACWIAAMTVLRPLVCDTILTSWTLLRSAHLTGGVTLCVVFSPLVHHAHHKSTGNLSRLRCLRRRRCHRALQRLQHLHHRRGAPHAADLPRSASPSENKPQRKRSRGCWRTGRPRCLSGATACRMPVTSRCLDHTTYVQRLECRTWRLALQPDTLRAFFKCRLLAVVVAPLATALERVDALLQAPQRLSHNVCHCQ